MLGIDLCQDSRVIRSWSCVFCFLISFDCCYCTCLFSTETNFDLSKDMNLLIYFHNLGILMQIDE